MKAANGSDLNLASSNRVPALFVHGDADEGFAYGASRGELRRRPRAEFLLTLIGASVLQTLSVGGVGPADDSVILGTLDFLDLYVGSDKHALTRLRQHTNVPGVARAGILTARLIPRNQELGWLRSIR